MARVAAGIALAAANVTCGRGRAGLATPASESRRHSPRTAASASPSKKNSNVCAMHEECQASGEQVLPGRGVDDAVGAEPRATRGHQHPRGLCGLTGVARTDLTDQQRPGGHAGETALV